MHSWRKGQPTFDFLTFIKKKQVSILDPTLNEINVFIIMSPPDMIGSGEIVFPVCPSDCLSQNLVNATPPTVLAGSF